MSSRAGRHAQGLYGHAPRQWAYLVVVLDVSASPPSVCSVGLFSEPSPSFYASSPEFVTFKLKERHGATYREAYDWLLLDIRSAEVAGNADLSWVIPWLADDVKARLESAAKATG